MGLTPPADNIKPEFQLIANSEDITSKVRDKLQSLALTDATGTQADTLEIVLADDDPDRPIRKPPRGAELKLSIGYDGLLFAMGVFVVDEVGISGHPRVMTIRARGAPFEKSKGGASHLQTQKTRSWKRATTIDAMVSKIAKEHGMKSFVSSSLANVQLPHFSQTAESDVSFLVRVGKRYDAMVKCGGGTIAFLKRGEQKRADDTSMPTITVKQSDATNFEYHEASRDGGGTVVAFWHSRINARKKQVQVGSGEPIKQLRQYYTTEQAAKDAANAELDKRERGQCTFSLGMPGNPALSAECTLEPTGFHPDMPTIWLVTHVTHRLGSDGYKCDVEAELPNGAGD